MARAHRHAARPRRGVQMLLRGLSPSLQGALPARRPAALGARADSSTDLEQSADELPPAFERRGIRAGPLRSALPFVPVALLPSLQGALPARRPAALGARADSSTDLEQSADELPPAFERRGIRARPLRSALPFVPVALLPSLQGALPARRHAALGARADSSTDLEQSADELPPAFERRGIRARPLRSALPFVPVALLPSLQGALPARRHAALGARADSSTDC